MKCMTVFNVVLACCFAAFAVAPASAVDFKKLSRRQLDGLQNMKPRLLPPSIFKPGCTLYEHAGGGGRSWRQPTDSWISHSFYKIYLAKTNLRADALGKVSSVRCDWVYGKTECDAEVYVGPDLTGASFFIGSRSGTNNLPANLNDRVSSIYIQCSVL